MADSVRYLGYAGATRQTPFLLIVVGGLIVTGILAFLFWGYKPVIKDKDLPQVAPMVPNPTPIPNPH